MEFIKDGIFWRIRVDDYYVSKKKFLTENRAVKYYENTQDKFGMPIIRKERYDKNKSNK